MGKASSMNGENGMKIGYWWKRQKERAARKIKT
jgi:hypothetical protein